MRPGKIYPLHRNESDTVTDELERRSLDRRALALRCGQLAPLVAGVAILAATTLDGEFAWTESALSDTGALPPDAGASIAVLLEDPSIAVFDGGMLLAGLIGLPFAGLLFADAANAIERLGAVAFAAALIALAGVGVFPLPHALHGPAAILHFAGVTLFLWVYGTGAVLGGRPRFGIATVWVGIAQFLFWLLWAVALRPGPIPGIAIPELVSAVAFGGWSFAVATRRRRR